MIAHCMIQPIHTFSLCFYKRSRFLTAPGDREVLDNSIAEEQINNEQQPPPPAQPPGADAGDEGGGAGAEPEAGPSLPAPPEPARPVPHDLDVIIARMQRDLDVRLASGDAEGPPFSPPPRADQQADGSLSHTFSCAFAIYFSLLFCSCRHIIRDHSSVMKSACFDHFLLT